MELWEEISKEPKKIAGCIEHTNIKIECSRQDIKKLCREVLKYKFYGAAILPYYVELASKLLKGKAKVITVIGFPYGIQPTSAKVAEVREVFEHVDEFDMIFNRAAFLNHDYSYVVNDIKEVVKASSPKIVKVIIETPSLTTKQIRSASQLVVKAGAHFVKTAIGYAGPTKVEHVKIIKDAIKNKAQIKASGGIRSFAQALEMIKAGATRIGTSAGVEIIKSIAEKHGEF